MLTRTIEIGGWNAYEEAVRVAGDFEHFHSRPFVDSVRMLFRSGVLSRSTVGMSYFDTKSASRPSNTTMQSVRPFVILFGKFGAGPSHGNIYPVLRTLSLPGMHVDPSEGCSWHQHWQSRGGPPGSLEKWPPRSHGRVVPSFERKDDLQLLRACSGTGGALATFPM